MIKINKLYYNDCLEVMKDIPNKSMNLIIADIPYNIGKDKNWDKWKKQDDYIQYIGERFLQCQRVLKDNGSFYWFHNDFLQIVKLQNWIGKNTEFVFKQLIVWNKRFEGVKNKGFLDGFIETNQLRNYQKMVEYILFYTFQDETGLQEILAKNNFLKISEKIRNYVENNFSKKYIETLFFKEGRYTSRLSAKVHASYKMGWNNGERFDLMDEKLYNYLNKYLYFPFKYENLRCEYGDLRREYEALRYTFNNQKTHHSIWNYEIAPRDNHITPKPAPLVENIILHSSNEDDLILDPFAGSGTTAIACIRTGRNYILIEKEKKYIDIINKRIRDERAQLKIDFKK